MIYLWNDLETTGLDAEKCQVIEAAFQLGDVKYQTLVRPSVPFSLVHWEFFAREMHQKSGLYQEWLDAQTDSQNRARSLCAVEDDILEMIAPFPVRSVMLAGSSIHFDRGFLAKHMPRLNAALHYRHMDVSCLRTFFTSVLGEKWEFPAAGKPHRAVADLENSKALYERYASEVYRREKIMATLDASRGGK